MHRRRDDAKSDRDKLRADLRLAWMGILATVGFTVTVGTYYVGKHPGETHLIVIAGVLYVLMLMLPINNIRNRLRELSEEIQDADIEIELVRFAVSQREQRAEKLLRFSDIQLRRYYDLNLAQNKWVFRVGAVCIALGLGALALALWVVLEVAQETDTRIIVAILGGVSSFLVNYVGAIYLKMYANASSNLSAFHSRLVETHQMLLANMLAARIDEDAKRWDTISQLACEVAKKQ